MSMNTSNEYHDLPPYAQRFLMHMSTISAKSDKTVHEYYYDLRTFFRFYMCYFHKASFDDFDTLDCSDFSLNDLKKISFVVE